MQMSNEYHALLRSYFSGFIERSFHEINSSAEYLHNWHIEVMASALERCRRGETRRLIINLPPRYLKSICASVSFPAYVLGHNPGAQIICASYGQELADKHAIDTRSLMSSPFYRNLFPTRLSRDRKAVSEFTTTKGGFRLATSVGGVLTGRGADLIIIDDPLKPDEALSETRRKSVNEWYDNTLYSRLNDKRSGCIILIMQRLHQDDLVGHVQKHQDWEILKFPGIAEMTEHHTYFDLAGHLRTHTRHEGEALHPEREPLALLEELKQITGEYNFAGQYQQSPAPDGGGMIKLEWFKTYEEDDLPNFELVFQSWDTANKTTELSDYSVCTTWGLFEKRLFLLHVLRRRLEYPDLKRMVLSQQKEFSATTVLIEDKASGTQLMQDLRRDGVHGIQGYRPTMEKVLRMHSVSDTIENGFVFLPQEATWLAEFKKEVSLFFQGKFDDQVDSMSQALAWIRKGYYPYGLLGAWKLEQAALSANNHHYVANLNRNGIYFTRRWGR